jgi:hypothetical protein
MTAAPTTRVGLLVFDNNRLRDQSIYLEPIKTANGLSLAFVNGVKTVENAVLIHTNAGRLL